MLMEVLRSRRCSQISRIRQATNSQKVDSIREARPARPYWDWIRDRRLSIISNQLISIKVKLSREETQLITEMTSSFNLSGRWSHRSARWSNLLRRRLCKIWTGFRCKIKKANRTSREKPISQIWQLHWRTFSASTMTSRIKAASWRKAHRLRCLSLEDSMPTMKVALSREDDQDTPQWIL